MVSFNLFILSGIGGGLIVFFFLSRIIGILEPNGFKALSGYTFIITIPIVLVAIWIRTMGY